MALLELFNEKLKEALKSKDARQAGLLRMVKTRFQLRQAQKGPNVALTDEMALEEIQAYVNQMTKALAEFEKLGERGAEQAAQAHYEIDYLRIFLPKKLSETDTEALVVARIGELGLTQAKEMGKLMGSLMKTHKAELDANLVKAIASRHLTA